MINLISLFALVAAATASPLTHRFNPMSPTGRIVGGKATSIDEVPYQVSLQAFGFHFCGGSIISETWILTAAHCMGYSPSLLSIRAGSTLSSSGGSTTLVSEVVTHPDFDFTSEGVPFHDIALMRLSSPLAFDSTRAAIPLYNSGEEAVVGSSAVITGWGALAEEGEQSLPDVLQTVTVPIISKADCSTAYMDSQFGAIPEGQICAGLPDGGKDACQGDSGGPLAIGGRLAGVVSWGNGCARPGFPGVYTEVASYRSWISENSGV